MCFSSAVAVVGPIAKNHCHQRNQGSVYDKSGIRLMAMGVMQMFENERSEFQQSARAKIPELFHDDIAGPVANLQTEFQSAMKALA
jgi:hypothetical protein